MSELRHNLISKEWVIIAPERSSRPSNYTHDKGEKKDNVEYKKDCPFCLGNEDQTAPASFCLGAGKGWKVRVFPNKFPVLSSSSKKTRNVSGIFHSLSGYGIHEVIVEHHHHNTHFAFMNEDEVGNVIRTYKSRYESAQRDRNIEAITIFKNHGFAAGTSQQHPHSQLIATPIVTPQIRSRLEQAVNYFDDTGKCIFCQTLEDELKVKLRIIIETDHFAAFVPFAALSPFHIWIFPKRHCASFSQINEGEIRDLAKIFKILLGKLYYSLNNPDYNYLVRSIPTNESNADYFHWYISLVPRFASRAGFELGSGMYINPDLPEKDAEFLRNANPDKKE